MIRTSRDHRKQVWYRQEIRAVAIEDRTETHESHSEGGSTTVTITYITQLVLELQSGEKPILTAHFTDDPKRDYRPRAELEWVATQLRQALFNTADVPAPIDTHGNPLRSFDRD